MTDNLLADRTILVVEDEYLIADDLRRELVSAGARVIGPVASLARSLELIGEGGEIDGAILDINLGGESVYPAADLLRERGTPMIFSTGYDRSIIPPRFDDIVRCEKPVEPRAVTRSLATVLMR